MQGIIVSVKTIIPWIMNSESKYMFVLHGKMKDFNIGLDNRLVLDCILGYY